MREFDGTFRVVYLLHENFQSRSLTRVDSEIPQGVIHITIVVGANVWLLVSLVVTSRRAVDDFPLLTLWPHTFMTFQTRQRVSSRSFDDHCGDILMKTHVKFVLLLGTPLVLW